MVMVRRGSQEWRPAGGQPIAPPRPFERTDGTVMSEEEIKKVATPDSVFSKTGESPKGRKPTHSPDDIWNAVKRLGTQVAAARELDIKQGSVQSGLKRYMATHSIDGPLPGKLTSEQLRQMAQERAARFAVGRAEGADDVKPAADHAETIPVAAQPSQPTPLSDAFEKAAERERTRVAMTGRAFKESFEAGFKEAAAKVGVPVELVVHQDGEAHARSYNAGFEEGYEQGKREIVTDRAVAALFDWLSLYGPNWTQAQAELWFKALTATIDLIYPTADDAGEAAA